MYHFCTYCDHRYLIRALALYQSLARHANPFRLYVLCMDDATYEAIGRLPHAVPIHLDAFERGDEGLLTAKKDRTLLEYYFTCTPSLPLYVLNNFPDVDVVTYLDADLFFYGDPKPIFAELGDRSILIVGHRFPPNLRILERYGTYNVGWASFRNDASGRECLSWWRARCLEWCHDRPDAGRFADQKYLDDWPTRFQRVVVLQHKGGGLAPWNLSAYELGEKDGTVVVDNEPLIFFHFHHLKRMTRCLVDPGLDAYGARLDATARRRVYAPYVRELQVLEHRTLSKSGNGLHDGTRLHGRGSNRRWFRTTLLIVVGWMSMSVGPLPRTGLVVLGNRMFGTVQKYFARVPL